jgi:hypothetical protein
VVDECGYNSRIDGASLPRSVILLDSIVERVNATKRSGQHEMSRANH